MNSYMFSSDMISLSVFSVSSVAYMVFGSLLFFVFRKRTVLHLRKNCFCFGFVGFLITYPHVLDVL